MGEACRGAEQFWEKKDHVSKWENLAGERGGEQVKGHSVRSPRAEHRGGEQGRAGDV